MSGATKDVERGWFVIGRSAAVGARPQSVELLGRHWAVARAADGSVFALEDRCPHRQVPLSAGNVTETGLRCAYHGWTFDGAGACAAMPGLPKECPIPSLRIPALSVIERDGLVWGSLDDTGGRPLPRRVLDLDPARRRFLWQTRWGAPILETLENFLDALHTHTVHPGLVRSGAERRAVAAILRRHADGFTVEYEGAPAQSGLLYRLFESPRTAERAHFEAPGVAQIEYRYANGSAVWITLYFTPEAPESTHVFTTLHVAGRWAPAWAVRAFVWPFLRRVALQDQRMLALQTANAKRFPGRRHAVTSLDLVRPYLECWWGDSPPAELPDERRTLLML